MPTSTPDGPAWWLPLTAACATLTCVVAQDLPRCALTVAPLAAILLAASIPSRRACWPLSALAMGAALAIGSTWLHHAPAPSPTSPGPRTLEATVTSTPRRTASGWVVTARDDAGRHVDLLVPERVASFPPLPGRRVRAPVDVLSDPPPPFPWSPTRPRPLAIAQDAPALLASPEVGPATSLARRASARRLALERAARDTGATPSRVAFALAMTTGARGLLSPSQRDPFARTGTAHVLAISGLHLGALAALLWAALRALTGRAHTLTSRHGSARLCAPVTWACLALYVLAIGAPVSAMRALMMLSAALVGLLGLRRVPPLHALALAALGILLVDPSLIPTPGFALSASATLGILLAARGRPAQTRAERVALGVRISLAASLATAPAALWLGGEVPTAGLWLNLIVVPVVSFLAFPLALAGVLLAAWLPGFAGACVELCGATMELLSDLCALGYRAPGASWRPGPAPAWWLGLTAISILTALGTRGRAQAALAATTLALCAGLHLHNARPTDTLSLHFLPVGQGDATLAVFPRGATLLVDGGGAPHLPGRRAPTWDPGQRVVAPYLARQGVERVDLMVLTHPDADHLNGLFAALEAAPPRLLAHAAGEAHPGLRRLKERAVALGASLLPIHPGHTERLNYDGVLVELTLPNLPDASDNDRSVLVTLTHGRARALLPGDAEGAAESWWADHGGRPVTLLKAPHHGSATSSGPELLDAARPTLAVASCGWQNRHGHPHPDVLARYRARGVPLLRTDTQGLVRVDLASDGRVVSRATHLPPSDQAQGSPQEREHNPR
jgi:competence protein ComEC